MIIGMTLTKMDGNPYYSPQFNRGGNSAEFLWQLLNVTTNGEVDIDVEHKNVDDTTWGLLVNVGAASIVGPMQATGSAIKEQLRYKYILTGCTAEWDGVHILPLAPVWKPY